MSLCAACRREAPASILEATLSVLDFKMHSHCPACIDHRAEPLLVLIQTVNAAGWIDIPKEIRQAIRVYDMGEYVTVRTWAERLSKRQLVAQTPSQPRAMLPLDPDDEAVFQEVLAVWRRLNLPRRSQGPGHWLNVILTMFLPWRPA